MRVVTVFIDEESCIGCMQCVNAAPASFSMADDGRARTFCQRKSPDVATAVDTCPVNCMHYVGFDKLKELETARDSLEGDGRQDHRHFGKKSQGGWFVRTPLQ
jgi:ferredoxin